MTFDVFDTALLRCVPEPADVFEIAAYRLRNRGQIAVDPATYRQLRIRAETSARAEATRAGRAEVTLREIHVHLHAILPDADADAGVAEELAVETAVLVANEDVKTAYQGLASRGSPIAFISDTYLPQSFVRERLGALGFPGDVRLFASSSFNATKDSGTLFHIVSRELGVAPKRIVHLGDNRRADVVMGQRSGMRAYWYRPVISSSRMAADATLGERVIGRLEALARSLPKWQGDKAALSVLGVATIGPLLLGFTQWLAECLEHEPADLILYCSRDGYLVRRLMDLFGRNSGTRQAYFEVSRRSLNVPTIMKFDARAAGILCGNHEPLAVSEYFSRIGVDIVAHAAVVRDCGLEPDRIVSAAEDRDRLRDLFARLEDVVIAAVSADLPLLVEYCVQTGCFDASNIAIVDIGWGASLQASLKILLASHARTPAMRGFYLATDKRIHAYAGSAGRVASWLSHGERPAARHATISQGYWMLEIAFSAPHGSVLGYRRDGDRVVPVFLEYDRDAPASWAGRILQDEAYRFAERWKAIFGGIGPPITADAAMRRFEAAVDRPSARLARFFGEIVHVGGLGTTREFQAIAKPPSLGEWIRRPSTLRERYFKSEWKRGYLMRVFGSHRFFDALLKGRASLRDPWYKLRARAKLRRMERRRS